MCGRYTLTSSPFTLAKRFDLPDQLDFGPRYNIAPSQSVPAIVAEGEGGRAIRLMRWGLIPSWADDPAIGNRLINARAESIADKPAFRTAFRQRRCLIPADGFYEWRKYPGGKTPMYVRLKGGEPFAFAGLWETRRSPDGSPLESTAIITTEPNELVRPIHNRMPAIMTPEDEAAWLDPGTDDAADLLPMLRPYPSDAMEAYPVSRNVNSPKNDDPRCIEPAEPDGLFNQHHA